MKLRADITININATDYISAADHQRAIENLYETIRNLYADAVLEFRQVRERYAAPSQVVRPRGRNATGALALYEE